MARNGFTPLEKVSAFKRRSLLIEGGGGLKVSSSQTAPVLRTFLCEGTKVQNSLTGFTLIEVMVVVVIIGILATLSFNYYSLMAERGRQAEAKTILDQVFAAEQAYYLEFESYTTNLSALNMNVPNALFGDPCNQFYYFRYQIWGMTDALVIALRCTTGGKNPNYRGTPYRVWLGLNGSALGTSGSDID